MTGSGSVTSATQDITGINVSSLADGTLTFSVTLTDAAGNVGTAATATATLDKTAPSGYTISADQATDQRQPGHFDRLYLCQRHDGHDLQLHRHQQRRHRSVTGSGSVTSATQDITRNQRLLAARRHVDLQRHLDRRSRQCRYGGHRHRHARHRLPPAAIRSRPTRP